MEGTSVCLSGVGVYLSSVMVVVRCMGDVEVRRCVCAERGEDVWMVTA